MSIGGIGGTSFWQQDQSYWNQSQSFYTQDQNYLQNQRAISQQESADSSLFSAMGSAQTLETTGLAQIATQEAQTRVHNAIIADEKKLAALSGPRSSSTTPSGPAPATGTGKVPLTTSTTLASLRIPPGGVITVSDGINTTSYQSTGTDTVADLIGAINANVAGNAYVTASLNAKGDLVITGKDMKESVTVGGTFAPSIGFAHGNQTFAPVAGSPASSSTSATSSASSAKTSSKSKSSGNHKTVPTATSQNISSAASLLGDSGVSGSLVNMLV
jgi:hypothetical protein